jgi:arginase
MRIAIIGAPMDLGSGRRGVDMGPTAIRCAGLMNQLQDLGFEVEDLGNIGLHGPETLEIGDPKLKYLEPIRAASNDLAERVASCAPDTMPIVLGGDHSIGLGSITGVAKLHGSSFGVLWVDAHGDFNTWKTTPSGNIHGMVLAALAGLGDPRLTSIGGFSPKVIPDHIVILGARSIDPGEKILLQENGVHVFTMHDIDRHGLPRVAEEALSLVIRGGMPLHVSFDIDVVDPRDAPGVGTPIPGGMTYRDAHLVMELIAETGALRSLDMVEVNPILDHANQTGELAARLICSAFGKRIM